MGLVLHLGRETGGGGVPCRRLVRGESAADECYNEDVNTLFGQKEVLNDGTP